MLDDQYCDSVSGEAANALGKVSLLLLIETGRRLVEKQNLWCCDQRAGDFNASSGAVGQASARLHQHVGYSEPVGRGHRQAACPVEPAVAAKRYQCLQ